jgi:hypothetical protein
VQKVVNFSHKHSSGTNVSYVIAYVHSATTGRDFTISKKMSTQKSVKHSQTHIPNTPNFLSQIYILVPATNSIL